MDKKVNPLRRRTIIGLFSMLAMPSLLHAQEKASDHDIVSGSEFATNYMASFGIRKFLLLDKREGYLKFISDGKEVKAISALSGRIKADNGKKFVTPAGIFAILRPIDVSNPKSGMVFDNRSEDSFLAIHRVINATGQKRTERLQSPSAEFKRISDGCINLTYDGFKETADFVLEAMRFNNAGGIIEPAYLVVLPEKTTLRNFPWPLTLPPLPKLDYSLKNN